MTDRGQNIFFLEVGSAEVLGGERVNVWAPFQMRIAPSASFPCLQ